MEQEQAEAVEIQEEIPLAYNLPSGGETPQEVVQEVVDVKMSNEVHASYDLDHVENGEGGSEDAPGNQDAEEDVPMETSEEPPVSEAAEAVVLAPKEVDIACNIDEGETSSGEGESPISEPVEAIEMEETPVELNCDTKEAPPSEGVAPSKEDVSPQISPKASPPITKMDLVNSITSAAQRKRRESSTDSEGGDFVPKKNCYN